MLACKCGECFVLEVGKVGCIRLTDTQSVRLKHRKEVGNTENEWREGQTRDKFEELRRRMHHNTPGQTYDNTANVNSASHMPRVAPQAIAQPVLSEDQIKQKKESQVQVSLKASCDIDACCFSSCIVFWCFVV